MNPFQSYIPIDRRHALAQWTSLPERAEGAALFADLSGFTALTEALAVEFGPQRGAEEISRQLGIVFEALIQELHRFGGSVLAFSGDAITCWLDEDVTGWRAVTCAFAMQAALRALPDYRTKTGAIFSLGVKTAVVAGPVRRFVVGDPERQLLDVIAGATLDRLAEVEQQAQRGDVIVSESTATALADKVEVAEWRQDETGQRFACLAQVREAAPEKPWPALEDEALLPDQMRPWILPSVFERLSRGQGEFLAELRPTAALFINFTGIDYEDEVAGFKLDVYIRHLQAVLAKFDGAPLQVTIGDKGSYVYAAFGAPVAHEDDAVRAISAALELRATQSQFPEITQFRMGIAQGRTYTGAYGSTRRRTYGVLGDSVNLAARLMQAAASGEILVSRPIHRQGQHLFSFKELLPLNVKGKTEKISVYAVQEYTGRIRSAGEAQYALPMVGREAELKLLNEKVQLALTKRGQLLAITGEAGMGKSRLLAEGVRIVREAQFSVCLGACESFGADTSYLVWQEPLRALFKIDGNAPAVQQMVELEANLRAINPAFVHRLPLLGVALNLPIPDNDLTRTFDAKLRKTSLESLLVDCFRAWAKQSPLAVVLEDCHWIDALSLDLLDALSQAIGGLPLLILAGYRPPSGPQAAPWQKMRQRPFFTEITLKDFTPQESEQLIQLKLQQVYGVETLANSELVTKFVKRAEGNPFYIEELLNYLRDRNIDPNDQATLAQLDLPASLHSLILSRIDQLTEEQKLTLKFASIIGRLFTAAALWGAYPQLGDNEAVKVSLQHLSRMELTVVDNEPELTYLFRHIVTQEVAYESLPFATRAILHGQIAHYIEDNLAANAPEQFLELLAYHYDRSSEEEKKRIYLLKAGEAAQAAYSNPAAQSYYRRLLPLLEPATQIPVIQKLAQVLELVGEWSEARTLYEQALMLAETYADKPAAARCETAIGELFRKRGQYTEAQQWLDKARAGFEALTDQAGVGQVLHSAGTLAAQQGQFEPARAAYEQSLVIRRALDDKPQIGALLSNLGIVARYLGDNGLAKSLHEEALAIRRSLNDRWAIAVSLNNIGNLALDTQDYASARASLEEAVTIMNEIGDKRVHATSLNNYANAVRNQRDFQTAFNLYKESLHRYRELGDRWGLAYLLEDMGILAAMEEKPQRAFTLVGAASTLRQAIGSPLSATEQTKLDAALAPARAQFGTEAELAAYGAGRALS
jgi:predicted ATPase/class 3 adenylate cyclase